MTPAEPVGPDEPDATPPDRAGRPADQPDAASGDGTTPETVAALTCDLCGSAMYERHCRIICPVCGYQRDCSDP